VSDLSDQLLVSSKEVWSQAQDRLKTPRNMNFKAYQLNPIMADYSYIAIKIGFAPVTLVLPPGLGLCSRTRYERQCEGESPTPGSP